MDIELNYMVVIYDSAGEYDRVTFNMYPMAKQWAIEKEAEGYLAQLFELVPLEF